MIGLAKSIQSFFVFRDLCSALCYAIYNRPFCMFMTEGLKNNPAKNIQIRFRKDFGTFVSMATS